LIESKQGTKRRRKEQQNILSLKFAMERHNDVEHEGGSDFRTNNSNGCSSVGEGEESHDFQYASSTSSSASFFDINTVMESVVRVTLAGFGGSIVGLSMEKRLEAMRVTTAAGLTAAARRKRSPSANLINLPLTWGFSCMIFCMIVDTCRLTSPATRMYQNVGGREGLQVIKDDKTGAVPGTEFIYTPAITVVDYAIGGAMAGMAGSFGRRMHFRNSIARMQGSRKFFGILPGLAFGIVAGCLQAGTDYGTVLAVRASTSNSPAA
jgi:hypothetical protein